MRDITSNPITGSSPRPEQACNATAWWKRRIGIPGTPQPQDFTGQAVCGRCQGTCPAFITSFESHSDTFWQPIPLDNWLLRRGEIRSQYAEQQLANDPNSDYEILADLGPLLEFIRCHWKSSRFNLHWNSAGPPPNTPVDEGGGTVGWHLFYGKSDNSDAAAAVDDLSMGGEAISNGNLPWIDGTSAQNTIQEPFPNVESYSFAIGDWKANPNEALLFAFQGWVLALSLRIVEDPGPPSIPVIWYYPILFYQLEDTRTPQQQPQLPSHPFRCTGVNRWNITYNPCQFSNHVLITKPFQP